MASWVSGPWKPFLLASCIWISAFCRHVRDWPGGDEQAHPLEQENSGGALGRSADMSPT